MMMNEDLVSRGSVVAGAAWLVVAGLLAAAWLVMLLSPSRGVALLLAATACASSAVAAVLQMRTYVVRICVVIRSTANLAPERPRVVDTR